LSEYEEARLVNIKENEHMLEAVGLGANPIQQKSVTSRPVP